MISRWDTSWRTRYLMEDATAPPARSDTPCKVEYPMDGRIPHARSDTLPGFLGLRAYSAISETVTEK
jgi:hypothetical protein